MLKAKVSTREFDKGYAEFKEALELMKEQPVIKIGILAEDANKDKEGPLNLAGIAAVNEFGTRRAGPQNNTVIPARSFIRSTMDENKQYFIQVTRGAIMKILTGADVIKQLNIVGAVIARAIQQKITDIRTPPNAPSTIAAKGSSKPLIDTGRMRASIRHKVVFSDEDQ